MKREFAEGNIKERPMGNGKKHLDAIEALGMGRQQGTCCEGLGGYEGMGRGKSSCDWLDYTDW